LRKLQSVIGFDIIERYEKIIEAIEDFENPYFDTTLEWYQDRLRSLKSIAKAELAVIPIRTKLDEAPLPKKKVVRTVVKRKVPRPGLMPKEEKKKAPSKKMTAIQRLIWEKKNKNAE